MNNETQVSIKFTNSVTGQKKLEQYAETLKKINTFFNSIDSSKAKEIDKFAKNTSNTNKNLSNTTKEVKNLSKNLKTALNVQAFTQLTKTIERFATSLSKFTKKSADYLENWNLLDVAFQNNTKEAERFTNTLSEMYGLDESWGYRTIGIFKQLSNAMGLSDEVGTKLAKTLTQLAIDTSSLYNIDVQDTVSILQSGLAGQTKPVRRLGGDITQTTLQTTLDSAGIERAINQLSYAEKRLVIVASLLNQTSEASGDWGRTLESVANQMRIFQQQTERLTRSLGNLFLPLLQKVLPYLNAMVMVLTEIIQWLALLVGYNPEEFDYFKGIDETVIDLKENLDGAYASTQKLQSGLRSFDKLNNIKTPTASGGGAGSGYGGIDPDILKLFNKASDDYLNNIEKVEMKATKIRDRIMEWLGFTKKIDKETADVSFKFKKITSGTILGALAVGGTIFSGVTKIYNLLKKIGLINFGNITTLGGGGVGAFGVIASSIALLSYSIYDLYNNNQEFANSINEKWAEMQTTIQPIIENLINLFTNMTSIYSETLKPMFDELYEIIQTFAQVLLEILYPVLNDLILPTLNLIIDVFNSIINIINKLWKEYGEPISTLIQQAIKDIAKLFKDVWESTLEPIITNLMSEIKRLWDNYLSSFFEKVGGVIAEVTQLILVLWDNVLQPLVSWFVQTLAPIISSVVNSISNVVGGAIGFMIGIINGILDVLKGVIGFLTGVFSGDLKKAMDGIVNIFRGVGNTIITIFEGVVNFVIDLMNMMISAIYNGVKSLINGVLSTVENVADFFGFDVDLTISSHAPRIPKIAVPRLKQGIDFVPNDYYPAYLDYGERVLTRQENEDYQKGIINGENATNGQPINATFIVQVGDETIATKVLNNLQEMAKSNGEPITIG